MTDVRPVKEAENRLAGFNRDKSTILSEVERRVVERLTAAAERGGDASLEYVLNEAAFHEIRRLERGASSGGEKKRLGAWRELARSLGGMGDDAKRARLTTLVREYAHDVCGNFDVRVYKFATGIMPSVMAGLLAPQSITAGWKGLADLAGRVVVDGPLEHIRACADRGTLVVTPTHSSNMDSVVLGWSLMRAGLPPVTYGAGKNLFSNRFISFFMHNLGAYRVDRRLTHGLYKEVLKEYSTVLLERGYHSLFFPGGTRCRSGMVERKLKLGLLGTTVTAYQRHLEAGAPQKRVYVVPATLNYGIVLEAETLIEDYLAEEGKARYIIEDDEFSRIGRILDFARKILALEGSLVIRYGAPYDPFGNRVDEDGESLDARGRRVDPAQYLAGPGGKPVADPQRDAEYTRGLGEELARAYPRLTVFQSTNLVARVLFDHVAARERTRDVYKLLRAYEGTEVPIEAVREDVGRWRAALAAHPDVGALPERAAALPAGDVVDDALRMLRAYHSRPVAERIGERVAIRDMRLLYYYQNRMAHIDARAIGAPVAS